jgi:hypothetical protein
MDKTAQYFLNNKAFVRYDEYLALGLPLGSRAAEGVAAGKNNPLRRVA